MSSWPSISSIAKDVNSGKLTATSLVNKSLDYIAKNKEYNAIISTTEKRARKRAIEIDELVKKGKNAGRLAGVPFIAKDNILCFGAETTAASNILKSFNAPYQATVIEKIEAEGGICVAKSNLDAFAHGSSTENSDFCPTKNPIDNTRVPGGSSGGSSTSVALGMVPFALGTDTGGSIRLPASFCGAVGYKPTYGIVSRNGVIAMASSTDVVGPLTTNVDDAAYILEIIAGRDPLDSTTIARDSAKYTDLASDVKGKKIGVIKEYFSSDLNKNVRSLVEDVINKLQGAGATIEEVSLPSISLALACYYIIVPAEISSNLSRYDGQRFGYASPQAKTLDESYTFSRSLGFGNEAKRRIMIGTYVLSSGYYDAYYKRAQKLRTKLINEFNKAFEEVDFLVGPTAPTTAFKLGENTSDPLQMYLTDIMTVAANLVGVPAISIPAGLSNGLPVGFQIISKQRADRELLGVAKVTEEIINE